MGFKDWFSRNDEVLLVLPRNVNYNVKLEEGGETASCPLAYSYTLKISSSGKRKCVCGSDNTLLEATKTKFYVQVLYPWLQGASNEWLVATLKQNGYKVSEEEYSKLTGSNNEA
jgi:hypothetical protein